MSKYQNKAKNNIHRVVEVARKIEQNKVKESNSIGMKDSNGDFVKYSE